MSWGLNLVLVLFKVYVDHGLVGFYSFCAFLADESVDPDSSVWIVFCFMEILVASLVVFL